MHRRRVGPGRVAEGDVLERQPAARRLGQRERPRRRGDGGLLVQQLVEPARRAGAAQQVAVDFGQRAERARDQHAGQHERGDRAAAERAFGDLDRAAPQQQRDRAEDHRDHDRGHRRAQQDAAPRGVEGRLDRFGETLLLAPFLVEALHDLHRPEHFGDAASRPSATRSWLSRETVRRRRPNQTIGSSTSGTPSSSIAGQRRARGRAGSRSRRAPSAHCAARPRSWCRRRARSARCRRSSARRSRSARSPRRSPARGAAGCAAPRGGCRRPRARRATRRSRTGTRCRAPAPPRSGTGSGTSGRSRPGRRPRRSRGR